MIYNLHILENKSFGIIIFKETSVIFCVNRLNNSVVIFLDHSTCIITLSRLVAYGNYWILPPTLTRATIVDNSTLVSPPRQTLPVHREWTEWYFATTVTYPLPMMSLRAERFPYSAANKVGVIPSSSDVFKSFFVARLRGSRYPSFAALWNSVSPSILTSN